MSIFGNLYAKTADLGFDVRNLGAQCPGEWREL
jgi:hypothetical protein